jgi:hypothetical protein
MSLAVVIAVGAAFAFKPAKSEGGTTTVDLVRVSNGVCTQDQNITLPENCDPGNGGVVCQIMFGGNLHNIRQTSGDLCDGAEYKKPTTR